MNKVELVASVAEKTGLAKKDAEKAVSAVLESIVNAVAGGDKVQLVGFGTFEVRERGERTGRNPRTKEAIVIPASKQPVFKAGQVLQGRCGEVTRDVGKGRPDRAAFLLCKRERRRGMLHLLLGRSGFGKTHTVLARLEELARTEESRPPGPAGAGAVSPLKARGRCWTPGPSSGRGCKGMEFHQVGRSVSREPGRASWTANG